MPGSHSMCMACHLWRGPSTPREALCSGSSPPGSAPIINKRISHSLTPQEDFSRAGLLFHFPPGRAGQGAEALKPKTFLSEPVLDQGSPSICAEEKVGGKKPGPRALQESSCPLVKAPHRPIPAGRCALKSVMSNSLQPYGLQPTRHLSMGCSRQEYWSGLPRPPLRDLPYSGFELESPALAGAFFTTSATWEAWRLPRLVDYKPRDGFLLREPRSNIWIKVWPGLLDLISSGRKI